MQRGEGGIGHRAGEDDVAAAGELPEQQRVVTPGQPGVVPPGPGHGEPGTVGQRPDQPVDPLVRGEPPDEQHPVATAPRIGREPLRIRPAVHHPGPVGRNPEHRRGEPRDGQKAVEQGRQDAEPAAPAEPVIGRHQPLPVQPGRHGRDPARRAAGVMGVDDVGAVERPQQLRGERVHGVPARMSRAGAACGRAARSGSRATPGRGPKVTRSTSTGGPGRGPARSDTALRRRADRRHRTASGRPGRCAPADGLADHARRPAARSPAGTSTTSASRRSPPGSAHGSGSSRCRPDPFRCRSPPGRGSCGRLARQRPDVVLLDSIAAGYLGPWLPVSGGRARPWSRSSTSRPGASTTVASGRRRRRCSTGGPTGPPSGCWRPARRSPTTCGAAGLPRDRLTGRPTRPRRGPLPRAAARRPPAGPARGAAVGRQLGGPQGAARPARGGGPAAGRRG